jgi:hypothetical protein
MPRSSWQAFRGPSSSLAPHPLIGSSFNGNQLISEKQWNMVVS